MIIFFWLNNDHGWWNILSEDKIKNSLEKDEALNLLKQYNNLIKICTGFKPETIEKIKNLLKNDFFKEHLNIIMSVLEFYSSNYSSTIEVNYNNLKTALEFYLKSHPWDLTVEGYDGIFIKKLKSGQEDNYDPFDELVVHYKESYYVIKEGN